MFGLFKMSEEQQLLLAQKNLTSFIKINDDQIRKYSNLELTSLRISFTTQKIVLVLDAMFKVASFSNNFKYKNIATNNLLYGIIGDYLIEVLYEADFFPDYSEFKEHSDLILNTLFKKLVGDDDTMRNKIYST